MRAKTGRKQKPYQTTWGEIVPGLARQGNDGRWRIVATGERFTETDERRAVARAKAAIQKLTPPTTTTIGVEVEPVLVTPERRENSVLQALNRFASALDAGRPASEVTVRPDGTASLSYEIESATLWPQLREQLIQRPAWVAEKVGIPELASLARFDLPKPSIRVQQVIDAYTSHSTATEKTKREALSSFRRLVDFAAAKTLDDLSQEKLLAFRAETVASAALRSTGTIAAYFNRIRNVLRVGIRAGLDAAQIGSALVRCQVLFPPASNVADDPRPISRDNFHRLLEGAAKTQTPEMWRAMLLMALNAALYLEDICSWQ